MLYVFGRIVEEEEGVAGVLGTYVICGVGESRCKQLHELRAR